MTNTVIVNSKRYDIMTGKVGEIHYAKERDIEKTC
jgi:hypothetical protein